MRHTLIPGEHLGLAIFRLIEGAVRSLVAFAEGRIENAVKQGHGHALFAREEAADEIKGKAPHNHVHRRAQDTVFAFDA